MSGNFRQTSSCQVVLNGGQEAAVALVPRRIDRACNGRQPAAVIPKASAEIRVASTETVSSIAEALALATDQTRRRNLLFEPDDAEVRPSYGVWFRGQSNAAWAIIPSVFRTTLVKDGKAIDGVYSETSMFHQFQLLAPEHHRSIGAISIGSV